MKIYVVGFMGAGKTTVGRELAARLDVPFFDLDDLVEAAEKSSIKDIFAQHGEAYFRKRERDLLRSTKYLDSAVVATGGGGKKTKQATGRGASVGSGAQPTRALDTMRKMHGRKLYTRGTHARVAAGRDRGESFTPPAKSPALWTRAPLPAPNRHFLQRL